MLQVQSHRQTATLPALMLIVLALLTGCASLSPEEAQAKREEIDQMERSEIESVRYVDYREIFAPFALAGLIAICLEAALATTIFRRIP